MNKLISTATGLDMSCTVNTAIVVSDYDKSTVMRYGVIKFFTSSCIPWGNFSQSMQKDDML